MAAVERLHQLGFNTDSLGRYASVHVRPVRIRRGLKKARSRRRTHRDFVIGELWNLKRETLRRGERVERS